MPEMRALRQDLQKKFETDSLGEDERKLFTKLQKCVLLLANNPKHPGLASHEISSLTKRYGVKVWQSYLENRKPAAGRIFWVFGPVRGVITVIGLEPHPESGKSRSYDSVTLSAIRATQKESEGKPEPGHKKTLVAPLGMTVDGLHCYRFDNAIKRSYGREHDRIPRRR